MRHYLGHVSLIHGWLPIAVQIVTGVVLACAAGGRSRRWRRVWLPVAIVSGLALAAVAHCYIDALGVAGEPAPRLLWAWIAGVGLALGALTLGWRRTRWWRRGLAALAVPMCVLSAALTVNTWVGYFPTVHTAWSQFTAGPLPDQTDRVAVTMMQLAHIRPGKGVVVPVRIPGGTSRFHHRRELVYLPPAWFHTNPAPALPTVMMIGSALNTPADWLRAGHAIRIVDDFAAAHGGNAPVLVFVDATGAFDNDTECVNGVRGNAADHLTKEVVPYMISNFRVSADRSSWGIVGWSMGGTCAVDLTVMHPDLFSAFVDIAGDAAPNMGDRAQTITALFGGDAGQYAAFDPNVVISSHGRYTGVYGWFEIPGDPVSQHRAATADGNGAISQGDHDPGANPEGQDIAANGLCRLGSAHGIRCSVVVEPGRHDWPFAAQAFGSALPWLAGRLGTPEVPQVPLPGLNSQPTSVLTVAQR